MPDINLPGEKSGYTRGLVSVIITTHNRKELLKEAVESVLMQTYPSIECIVVDDAGDDGTEECIVDYIHDGSVIYIYIPKEKSKGGNHARNIGILASHGEYIAFLDDDDEWMPEKICRQVEAMSDPAIGFVYCKAIREYNLNPRDRRPATIDDATCRDGDLSKEILSRIITTTSAMMIRRSVADEVGLFDENLKYWQEYEYCIRILQATKAKCVRENLIIYRVIDSDKNRLTNHIVGWEDAVNYILRKHRNLFNSLSGREKGILLRTICTDGYSRAKRNNDSRAKAKYLFLALKKRESRKFIYSKVKNTFRRR